MISYESFEVRARDILERIHESCVKHGRDPQTVQLLPVTKGHPVDAVDYVERFGLKTVGENWIQEVVAKKQSFKGSISWECIGHVQRNKAKLAVQHFDRIQSIDSVKLASKISIHAQELGKVQRILLEVNAGEDPNKYGVLPNGLDELVEAVLNLPNLQLEGFMTIAPLDNDRLVAEKAFFKLFELRESVSDRFNVSLPELSMGMSDDFDQAIKAGSTLVRIGTALFGERTKK